MLGRFKRLSPYVIRQWRILVCIAALTILSSGIAALQPWPMKLLVDGLARYGQGLGRIFGWSLPASPLGVIALAAAGTCGIYAVTAVVSSGLTWCWSILGQRMVH